MEKSVNGHNTIESYASIGGILRYCAFDGENSFIRSLCKWILQNSALITWVYFTQIQCYRTISAHRYVRLLPDRTKD